MKTIDWLFVGIAVMLGFFLWNQVFIAPMAILVIGLLVFALYLIKVIIISVQN